MRDLSRLIFVALLSFAIVGIAMLYSRGGDLGASAREFARSISDTLDGGQAMMASTVGGSEPAPALTTLSVARPNSANWVGLAGFPDQSEIAFPLPRGGSYLSGALVLALDTELSMQGDGLLTLSVNGTTRGQVVLDSGVQSHQVRIDLTQADLLGESVLLQMSGRGTTSGGQICPTDATNSGAAVTLTAMSRLELVTDQPQSDPIATLAAGAAPLALPLDGDDSQAAMTIWAAQQLSRAGIAARIGNAGAEETALHVADSAASAAGMPAINQLVGQQAVARFIAAGPTPPPSPVAWPVAVTDLGMDTTIKTFRGGRRWIIPYAVNDLPGGHLPASVDLKLKTTPLTGNNEWVVRIGLNGNLVESRRLPGASDTIAFNVPLPPERARPNNKLVIDLIDTTPSEGNCGRPHEAQAQLLPETTLQQTTESQLTWVNLVEALAIADEIDLSVSESLTAAQAETASKILGMVLPRKVDMTFDGSGDVRLVAVSRATLAHATAQLGVAEPVMALFPANSVTMRGGVVALPMPSTELGAALERLRPNDVIILVSGL